MACAEPGQELYSARMLVATSLDSINDPAKDRKLNYEKLEDRMKTFNIPPQWDGPVDYQSMAEAGFVYTGQEDLVYCFSCNIKLDRWSKHMEPLLRHKEESPTCSFMRQKLRAVKGEKVATKSVVAPFKPLNAQLTSSIGQLQSSSLVTSKAIHTVVTGLNESRPPYGGSFDDCRRASLPITPENYQSEEERIKSFIGWPLNEAVYPEQLARVGFVYTGEGALVQCFQCGVKYRHWYKGDVPLNVHQKCNPRCPFLQTFVSESKTRSYIEPESDSCNTEGEEVSKPSLQFPDYSEPGIRLRSFKHQCGVLPAQELAKGGFYMIGGAFLCDIAMQDWKRSGNVMYGRCNGVFYMITMSSCVSKNTSKDSINNSTERIQRIQYSPYWWFDDSDIHFGAVKSRDGTLTSFCPSKMKVMVWLLTLWKGPVENHLIAKDDFVYARQKHPLNNLQLVDDVEPLLRPEEETPATRNQGRKLQAIEGGKRSVAAPSKPPEQQLGYERSDKYLASALVVGTKGRERSEASDAVNLPVQTEQNEFSTTFTSLQQSADSVHVIPLLHFMDVTRGQKILSFSGSGAVDQLIPDDVTSEERGAIYPPDFDVPSDVPSDPVQPSEGDDRSAVIIDVTNVSMLMKTNFVSSSPLNDMNKFSEASNTSGGVVEELDGQLIEKPHEFVCQICKDCKVETVLLPCGHARTCRACAERIVQDTRRCPFCRKGVDVVAKAIILPNN